MKQSLISVIVPVYNTAPWLARCLDSICSQSYTNLEILCVNDGSTDNSAEILEVYAARDARIRVFTQENAGLSAARNIALEHATGEWVTGVDSDDYLFPDAYEKALFNANNEIDLIFYGVCCVSEGDNGLIPNSYFNLPPDGEYNMSPELASKLNVCFCGKLWRRTLIEDNKLRFPVGLVHEDEAMYYLSCPYIRKVAISSSCGYVYIQREGSITNDGAVGDLTRIHRYIPILEYVYNEYKTRRLLSKSKRVYLCTLFIKLLAWIHRISNPTNKKLLITLAQQCVIWSGLKNDNYLLERFFPYEKLGFVTVRRYARIKIYYFFLLPIKLKIYNSSGHLIAFKTLASGFIKNIFSRNYYLP